MLHGVVLVDVRIPGQHHAFLYQLHELRGLSFGRGYRLHQGGRFPIFFTKLWLGEPQFCEKG